MQYVSMQYVNGKKQYVNVHMQYASMQYVNIQHAMTKHALINMHAECCSKSVAYLEGALGALAPPSNQSTFIK